MFSRIVSFLVVTLALFAGFSYSRKYLGLSTNQFNVESAAEQVDNGEPNPPPSADSAPGVKFDGPLAEWMDKAESYGKEKKDAPREWKLHPSDHVGDSPVGTSARVLNKTFALSSAAQYVFEVPPHAASPQLHGNFKSFVRHAGPVVDAEAPDIEFLLLNDSQYEELVSGRPGDALFSADAAHDQDINFRLPATLDQPTKYYLIFRNSVGTRSPKTVKADFQIDF
jgi:hypothetical protein